MKRMLACLLFWPMIIPTAAPAAETAHWGYSGHEGPQHWGELSAAYEACASGKHQSPVNLQGFSKAPHPALKVSYTPGGSHIVHNGHTIQVNYDEGSSIRLDDQVYQLKQFHFHSPSENTVEGHAYPMEAHFVHADAEGNLAVVAVLFRAGKHNAELEKAWAQMPGNAGESRELSTPVNANALLPRYRTYYRFDGSLTTPPCTEGVKWFVMAHAETASPEQLERFTHTMHHPNNRPVQPLNSRLVTR